MQVRAVLRTNCNIKILQPATGCDCKFAKSATAPVWFRVRKFDSFLMHIRNGPLPVATNC